MQRLLTDLPQVMSLGVNVKLTSGSPVISMIRYVKYCAFPRINFDPVLVIAEVNRIFQGLLRAIHLDYGPNRKSIISAFLHFVTEARYFAFRSTIVPLHHAAFNLGAQTLKNLVRRTLDPSLNPVYGMPVLYWLHIHFHVMKCRPYLYLEAAL